MSQQFEHIFFAFTFGHRRDDTLHPHIALVFGHIPDQVIDPYRLHLRLRLRTGPIAAAPDFQFEGVEGTGSYGGTWLRVEDPTTRLDIMFHLLSSCTLVRWSPFGYPIVPHVAKRYEVSDDNRQFTFWLREGMRWSDGHPFTADDIMYWWEHEMNDPQLATELLKFWYPMATTMTVTLTAVK